MAAGKKGDTRAAGTEVVRAETREALSADEQRELAELEEQCQQAAGEYIAAEHKGTDASARRTRDDGQSDLPSGGHAELPGGGQRDYLV
jgi:hypothetical protein